MRWLFFFQLTRVRECRRFLELWPPGSPAFLSYYRQEPLSLSLSLAHSLPVPPSLLSYYRQYRPESLSPSPSLPPSLPSPPSLVTTGKNLCRALSLSSLSLCIKVSLCKLSGAYMRSYNPLSLSLSFSFSHILSRSLSRSLSISLSLSLSLSLYLSRLCLCLSL